MFWFKDKREKDGIEAAEHHAAVLRRLREVIDYRPEAPGMVMALSQDAPPEATVIYARQ